jgi:hypothetical protein
MVNFMSASSHTYAWSATLFTVLVIDPDVQALGITVRHIQARVPRATLIAANSYVEGLSKARTMIPNLLIFACQGSLNDWRYFLTAYIQACPLAKVVLTGRSSVPFCEDTNILGFLQKPYRVDELIAFIEYARKGYGTQIIYPEI